MEALTIARYRSSATYMFLPTAFLMDKRLSASYNRPSREYKLVKDAKRSMMCLLRSKLIKREAATASIKILSSTVSKSRSMTL